MDKEIRELRQEAKATFSPAKFSKSARLERKANAIEKDKNKIRELEEPNTFILQVVNALKVSSTTFRSIIAIRRYLLANRVAFELHQSCAV
jgi:hypothetical protein